MLNIFLSSILVLLIFTPIGIIVKGSKDTINKDFELFSGLLIYSTIFISFLALLINFFSPLTYIVNTFLIFISLIFILLNKSIFFNTKFIYFLILSGLIIFFLIVESNTYRPDAGLYHFPYISIINNEKIIFGLSNFNFRFAHISIIQYLSAITNNLLFSSNGMVFPAAIIYAGVVCNFFSKIKKHLNNKKFNYHFFYLIGVLIYILGKMHRYSEFGNDTPGHLLFFYLISEIFKSFEENSLSNIRNCLTLSIFIFLNKIFLIFGVILTFVLINKNNIRKVIINSKILFAIFFLFLWIIKNIIISGCAIFPVKSLCIANLKWTNIDEVSIVSNENEAWAKGWYVYKNKKKVDHSKYIKNFIWIDNWVKSAGLKYFKIISIYILSLIIIFLTIINLRKKKNNLNNLYSVRKKIILLTVILLFSVLTWLYKIPDYRYGTSYLISLIAISFAILCCDFDLKKNYKTKINIFLICSILIFFSKNSSRIITEDKLYNNYPWPKYYSHGDGNIYKKPKTIILKGKKLYQPGDTGLCMYGLSPCSNKSVDFKVENKYGYFFFTIK